MHPISSFFRSSSVRAHLPDCVNVIGELGKRKKKRSARSVRLCDGVDGAVAYWNGNSIFRVIFFYYYGHDLLLPFFLVTADCVTRDPNQKCRPIYLQLLRKLKCKISIRCSHQGCILLHKPRSEKPCCPIRRVNLNSMTGRGCTRQQL